MQEKKRPHFKTSRKAKKPHRGFQERFSAVSACSAVQFFPSSPADPKISIISHAMKKIGRSLAFGLNIRNPPPGSQSESPWGMISPPSLWRYPLPWPGVKGVARRKHRPGVPFSGRLRLASAEGGGPIGRPPVAPTRIANRRGDPRPVGPTGPGNGRCLMVSAGNALDPGPEKASPTLTFI
jgi:hypothetical protein